MWSYRLLSRPKAWAKIGWPKSVHPPYIPSHPPEGPNGYSQSTKGSSLPRSPRLSFFQQKLLRFSLVWTSRKPLKIVPVVLKQILTGSLLLSGMAPCSLLPFLLQYRFTSSMASSSALPIHEQWPGCSLHFISSSPLSQYFFLYPFPFAKSLMSSWSKLYELPPVTVLSLLFHRLFLMTEEILAIGRMN